MSARVGRCRRGSGSTLALPSVVTTHSRHWHQPRAIPSRRSPSCAGYPCTSHTTTSTAYRPRSERAPEMVDIAAHTYKSYIPGLTASGLYSFSRNANESFAGCSWPAAGMYPTTSGNATIEILAPSEDRNVTGTRPYHFLSLAPPEADTSQTNK